MIKNFIIIWFFWLGGEFVLGWNFTAYYELVFAYLAENQINLFVYGTLGSLGFVFIAYILRDLGLFSLMRLFSKLIFEFSQFVICFVSIFAVIFVFQQHLNLWKDLGILAVVPFEMLLASCASLTMFDFNYPLGEKLLNNVGVPALSILTVILSSLI